MQRNAAEIAGDIASLSPRDGYWHPLDALPAELWATGHAVQELQQRFFLFERFPEEDGTGISWPALHGIESLEGYEPEFLCSLERRPSEMAILLAGRMLDDGTCEIEGQPITRVLDGPASSSQCSLRLQLIAGGFLNRRSASSQ